MAGIFNLITKLFGNKYAKDIKSIEPIVKQIHAEYEKITAISNDELRSKTIELKAKIEESVFSEKEEITSLKSKADEKGIGIDEKEEIYNKIDEIEKSIVEKTGVTLNEILPTAFAVVKETATRFSNKILLLFLLPILIEI